MVGARKFDNYRVRTCDYKLLDKDDKIVRWTYMKDWPKWQGSLFAYQMDPLMIGVFYNIIHASLCSLLLRSFKIGFYYCSTIELSISSDDLRIKMRMSQEDSHF